MWAKQDGPPGERGERPLGERRATLTADEGRRVALCIVHTVEQVALPSGTVDYRFPLAWLERTREGWEVAGLGGSEGGKGGRGSGREQAVE